MNNFIIGLLVYVLGSAAIISVASIFGIYVSFFQAISVWIVLSLLVNTVKNF